MTFDGTLHAVSADYVFTPDCPWVCLLAIPETNNHSSSCRFYQIDLGTAWCPTCHNRVQVEEVDAHCSTYRGDREYEWTATRLACGHVLEGPERVVGPSPGGEAAAEAMAGAATQARLARTAEAQDLSW